MNTLTHTRTLTVAALVLLLAAGASVHPSVATAQTTTAFKTGERTRGQVKDCFYEALGQEYVYSVSAYALCPLTVRVSTGYNPPATPATAFKTGERLRGPVKDCYYRALGRDYVYTVGSYELCPLSVPVP